MLRAYVTTALDVLGLLLIASGVAAGLLPYVGNVALAVAGGVVLGGSYLASERAVRRRKDGEFG